MCFDSKTFDMELYPGRAGQSQDNLPEWNMAFLEDGLRGFPWLHPQSLYPRLPDTPGPLTTQEETLQTPLHLLCCYSRGGSGCLVRGDNSHLTIWARLGPCIVHPRPPVMPIALGTVVAQVWFPFLEQSSHQHPEEAGGAQTAGMKGTVLMQADGGRERAREKTHHPQAAGQFGLCV